MLDMPSTRIPPRCRSRLSSDVHACSPEVLCFRTKMTGPSFLGARKPSLHDDNVPRFAVDGSHGCGRVCWNFADTHILNCTLLHFRPTFNAHIECASYVGRDDSQNRQGPTRGAKAPISRLVEMRGFSRKQKDCRLLSTQRTKLPNLVPCKIKFLDLTCTTLAIDKNRYQLQKF